MRRAVVRGYPYHITQRGTDQKQVFLEDRDRFVYLGLLREAGERYHLSYEGYCLMSNHVHLVAIPSDDDSLQRGLKWAHSAYSRYFHSTHGGCGHLWQARYYSCLLDGPYHWHAMAYVEMNPVRAGLAKSPEEHAWSSARAHLGLGKAFLPLQDAAWNNDWDEITWRAQLVSMTGDLHFLKSVRTATKTGRPLAYEDTITRLEVELGWSLRPRKTGPKPKALTASAGQELAQCSLEFGD
ncbi:MAG: transposase [Acidobacteria bacterium]|nr:transposase [Acidobacteriota bacterium]